MIYPLTVQVHDNKSRLKLLAEFSRVMLAFLLLSLQLALCSAECSEYIDIYDRYICISFLMPWDMVCGADGEYSKTQMIFINFTI